METHAAAPLLLTGFGPFESVPHNPSGAVARALHDGERVVGVELPVSFRRSAEALDAALAALGARRPHAILCTGVHPGASFRLERRARAAFGGERVDVDGDGAAAAAAAMCAERGDLLARLDLDALLAVLRCAGAGDVELSEDAGGFVCERVYRHALLRGAELGVPALFLHVPPLAQVALEAQTRVVGALVDALREAAR